jgi:uncharacterized protein (TIRG00374 family)
LKPSVRTLEGLVSYTVCAACLFWLFHDLPLERLVHCLAAVNGWLLAPAILLPLAAYLCVAWEWQLLLRPLGKLPFWRSAQAVFAGRFANDALPVHVGYFVRAFLASRWMGVSLAAIVPSLIVERLWDGFWLAVATGLLSLLLPLPPQVARARDVLATTVLAGVAATAAVIVLFRRQMVDPPATEPSRPGFGARVRSLLEGVAEGTRGIVRSRLFPAVFGLALLRLAVQAAAVVVLLLAFDIELSWGAELVIFVAAYLATCVPSLPAGTGLFQLFVVGVLEFFGVDKPSAASFSLVSFVTWTVPPAVAGFFALARSGWSLREIRRQHRGSG